MPLAKDTHSRTLDVLYTVMPRDYTDIKETHSTDRVSSTYGVLGGFLLENTPQGVVSSLSGIQRYSEYNASDRRMVQIRNEVIGML